MYLYKATCPDIPNPKQKGSRSQVSVQAQGPGQGRFVNHTPAGTGPRPYAPLMLWTANKPNSKAELKQLEEFLNFHSLSLHDSQSGMVYRREAEDKAAFKDEAEKTQNHIRKMAPTGELLNEYLRQQKPNDDDDEQEEEVEEPSWRVKPLYGPGTGSKHKIHRGFGLPRQTRPTRQTHKERERAKGGVYGGEEFDGSLCPCRVNLASPEELNESLRTFSGLSADFLLFFCGIKSTESPACENTAGDSLTIPEAGGDKEPALSDTDEGSANTGAAARLAKLARSYLCITATSVPSERVFRRLD
ncbi:unnamed protein product [Pleuronectes platessa]|uniref:Uncharacterized protein n=1 Tax=Pleuronectes platessa TaxID=8262 RepID=A0A9N7YGN7_PLEPL|nr:unnamed protein product [Pleuronectes platessa]